MEITYWIVAGLLALLYLAFGGQKTTRSKEKLLAAGIDFPLPFARVIGAIELLGAVGLILPPLVGIAPALGPTAGIGLAVVQIAAAITHVARREPKVLPINVALLAAAVVAAVTGFNVWG